MLTFALGFFTGAVGLGLFAWQVMPGMMLEVRESPYDSVQETIDRLVDRIEAHGWSNQAVRDMNASMSKHDVEMDRPVRVVELCNANHAKTVLRSNPEVSTMMPCAWGVYRGDDGTVYVSGMNMGLMGQLFGGTIAEVMGGTVAKQEEAMLEEALDPDASNRSSSGAVDDSLSAGSVGGDGAVPDSAGESSAAGDRKQRPEMDLG